jgi:hypothetical protein
MPNESGTLTGWVDPATGQPYAVAPVAGGNNAAVTPTAPASTTGWRPAMPAYNFTSVPFTQGLGDPHPDLMISRFPNLPTQIYESKFPGSSPSGPQWGGQYARWQFSNLGQGSPGPYGTPRGWGRWQTDPNWHYSNNPNPMAGYEGGNVPGGNNLPGYPQNPIGGLGGFGGVTPGGTGSGGSSQTPAQTPTGGSGGSQQQSTSNPIPQNTGQAAPTGFANFRFQNAAAGTPQATFNAIAQKYGMNDAYNWMMNSQWNTLGTPFEQQISSFAQPGDLQRLVNNFGAGGGSYYPELGGFNGGRYSWGLGMNGYQL